MLLYGRQAVCVLGSLPLKLVNCVYLKIHNGILTKSMYLVFRNTNKKINTIWLTFSLYEELLVIVLSFPPINM